MQGAHHRRRQLALGYLHAGLRGELPVDFVGSLEGFRLALDIDSKAKAPEKNTPSSFDLELAAAQQTERERRSTLVAIPRQI